jgi:hypothetical protein
MSDHPSIIEIKTLEKELHLLLQGQQSSGQPLSPLSPLSPSTLLSMKENNDKIIALIATIKNKIAIVYPKGITNQNVVRSNNANLVDIVNNLEAEQKELDRLIEEHNSLDGVNTHSNLQLNSSYYEYTFYLIITILFGIYIFKIYGAFSGYESVDMIMLISVVILLLYHFLHPVLIYGIEGIQSIGRRIMGVFYLL